MATYKPTSVRVPDECRKIIDLHGGPTEGINALVTRHQEMMTACLPTDLSQHECEALCGALKGWPLWLDAGGRLLNPGEALAMEVADYHRLDRESDQWPELDWSALVAKCRAYSLAQVMAVAHAVEAVFFDETERLLLPELVAHHFRLAWL
jgi:hypothetical protein